MKRWTLNEIEQKIKQDIDLEAEDFVTPEEFLAIINEGVDECEAHIHKFNREDEYFLTSATIDLVNGQSDYELPADIYANKILGLTYVNGSTVYPVKRMRNTKKFLDVEYINQNSTGDIYQYMITHASAVDGYRITTFPPSREDLTDGLKIWYIRNANELVNASDICDIPEFVYYIIAFVKYQVLFKEGHPNAVEAKINLQEQKALMEATLGEMVPDEDNKMIMDMDHYESST